MLGQDLPGARTTGLAVEMHSAEPVGEAVGELRAVT